LQRGSRIFSGLARRQSSAPFFADLPSIYDL
jgi:hypothetical protein